MREPRRPPAPPEALPEAAVIGLADDIARNMSAISARVSSIPGRTVMGIELPNANRQMVSFKELVACEAFAQSKGNLPIILGKDIAGEPVVVDDYAHAEGKHGLPAGHAVVGLSSGATMVVAIWRGMSRCIPMCCTGC